VLPSFVSSLTATHLPQQGEDATPVSQKKLLRIDNYHAKRWPRRKSVRANIAGRLTLVRNAVNRRRFHTVFRTEEPADSYPREGIPDSHGTFV
jgi:hypothetical protein